MCEHFLRSFYLFTLNFFYDCCVCFCHTMQISHHCTYIPSLLSLPPFPLPSLQVITESQTGLPVAHGNFSPAVRLIPGSMYMLVLLSLFVPLSPSPMCPQVHSPPLHLLSFPANRFINIMSLDFTHMC